MPGWVLEFTICVALVVMAFSMFQSPYVGLRRLGSYTLMFASGVAVWFWAQHSLMAAFCGVSLWFILPIGQAVWISRQLRFASARNMEPGELGLEEFPELLDLDAEVRRLGFQTDREYWLRPSPIDQGYRIYYHIEKQVFATIALVRQGPAVISYLIFLTPGTNGAVWITWDYPLAYGLKLPPEVMAHRYLDATSLAELFEQHLEFLKINEVPAIEQSPVVEEGPKLLQQLFDYTLKYNIREGLLRQTGNSPSEVNYTWRGTAFVSWQVFMEIARG